jgi:hypothetical protein
MPAVFDYVSESYKGSLMGSKINIFHFYLLFTACPPLPATQRPQLPPSPISHLSPPVLPPRISEKSVSSGNLAGRKYWSLRKFKRSVSASDQTSPPSLSNGPKKETATFYLTQALDADTGSTEGSLNRQVWL